MTPSVPWGQSEHYWCEETLTDTDWNNLFGILQLERLCTYNYRLFCRLCRPLYGAGKFIPRTYIYSTNQPTDRLGWTAMIISEQDTGISAFHIHFNTVVALVGTIIQNDFNINQERKSALNISYFSRRSQSTFGNMSTCVWDSTLIYRNTRSSFIFVGKICFENVACLKLSCLFITDISE